MEPTKRFDLKSVFKVFIHQKNQENKMNKKNNLILLTLILKMSVISCISFAASSSFEVAQRFTLARTSEYKCVPGDQEPNYQFACCVLQAQFIEFEDEKNLHLKSDQSQCQTANLRDLKFSLSQEASNGVRVYFLSEPAIEQTPFNSKKGHKTQMWLNVSTQFSFPKLEQPTSNGFYPFVRGVIGVDESEIGKPSTRSFGGYYSSEQGWKRQYQKIIDTTFSSAPCAIPIRDKSCQYRNDTIEEVWMNTIDGSTTPKMILKRYTYEGID